MLILFIIFILIVIAFFLIKIILQIYADKKIKLQDKKHYTIDTIDVGHFDELNKSIKQKKTVVFEIKEKKNEL